MSRHFQRIISLIFVCIMLALVSPFLAAAHEVSAETGTPTPNPDWCVSGVQPELLGKGMPSQADGYALVTARLTFEPGGSIGAHTHPGTLIATIDSGTLQFTLLSGSEMEITRAAVEGVATDPDIVRVNEEVELQQGDGFVEMGMVHSVRNSSDEEVVVLVSGLVEAGKPLTQCVDE